MVNDPILATEDELPALNNIERILENTSYVPKLVGPDGEEIELPQSLDILLRQIVHYQLSERAISIVSFNQELSIEEITRLSEEMGLYD